MLDAIRFTQGAVAKKDFSPELTHFRIENGTIRGFNGNLSLFSPISLDLKISPKALPFIKAVQACKETIELHVTSTGRLSIRSGKFKAFVDCLEEAFPAVDPAGEVIPLQGELLGVMKKLFPFIAEDASRPWARGILFRGQSAITTNNIVLLEYWLGYQFPVEINVPRAAIAELLRIGEEPTAIQIGENSCTFHFKGDRWLRTATCSTEWPDMRPVLERNTTQLPFPEGLMEAAQELMPFVDDLTRLFMTPGKVATSQHDGDGASVDLPSIQTTGCFNAKQLVQLSGIAKTVDFSDAPKPCIFYGDRIRGAIAGMRV